MSHTAFIWQLIRPHRKRIALAMIALLGVTLVGVVTPLVMAAVVDKVFGQGRYELLGPIALVMLLLPFFDGVFRTISSYLVNLLGQRVELDIRYELYRRVQRLSCQFMQNTTTGSLMERLRGDVKQVQMIMTQQTLGLITQLLCALLAIGIIFVLSWKLALLIGCAICLYVLNYRWFVRRIRKVQRRWRRKMDMLSGHAQERLAAATVVKAYGNERIEAKRFARRNFLVERVYHRFRMLNVTYGTVSGIIAWATYLGVLLGGVYLVIRGEMTYGSVLAVTAYTWWLLNPAIQIAELSNQFQQVRVSLDRIFELMHAPADAIDKTGKRLPSLRGEVAFENVCFQYEPNKPVLQHVNLYVQPGQTVALVGHTGCGKSTIVSLLYRFYEPQAGHLTIDGHDITQFDTRWYRGRIAIVPQDPIVFDTTVAENIAYGKPHASDEEIVAALKAVELSDIANRHPDGIHAPIGDWGLKLSVGERQRICIARAILADPTILILDEATSSLDSQSEALIQLALKRVMAGRTCFVVAHRLSTIVNADIIVVLDQGRVLEMGTHTQLMRRKGGHYRHLFTTQTANQRKTAAAV